MAKKSLSRLLSWFLLFLLVQLQTQTGSGSNPTSMEVIKLRVGVPKKDGFTQFVNTVWDPHEQKYNVSGYCKEVFDAVLNLLPFKVSVEIEPYVNQSRKSAGTYDTLVQQVPKKYDVAVGDITILASRSNFVDFALPYTKSGVMMLVPVQQGRPQTMWTFVRPFSWDLWLSIFVISMFIGFVILIMERKVNSLPDQQGSPNRQQLSPINILWFPISQAVLPEREGVAKNCSRFVLMVWLLLAFVLMQSYTASLTTMLTLEQLQPSFLSVDDLIKGGYYAGYQTDSFVYDLLVQRWKFNPSKLRAYSNISDYHHALKIGSQGGGVAAIIDEVPFLKLYLQKYGSNYMMAGPTIRTDGFGFAFPINSNLTAAFSRAILNVTESDIMDNIERKYFGTDEGWQDQSAPTSSATPRSLNFHSFSGLFLVTGIATLLALLVSETVIWQRPISMARAYSQKYLFRTPPSTETHVHPGDDSTHGIESV